MNKFLVMILIGFSSVNVIAAPQSTECKFFNNKKHGYTFCYPSSWYLLSEDDPDDITDLVSPVDEANFVTLFLNEKERAHCKVKQSCQLSVVSLSDGTIQDYEKAINYINKFRKNVRSSNTPKTKYREILLNNYRADLLVRESTKTEYETYIYIYCEKANRVFDLGSSSSYDSNYTKFSDFENKTLALEKLFTPDQLVIINSIQCPAPDFIYKPEKKAIKSKK